MPLSRAIAIVLVAAMTVAAAVPAAAQTADDARRHRDEVQRKRAQVAASLNELEATDKDLEEAVATLDREVTRAEAKAASARQAAQVADAAFAAATARLAATEQELASLRQAVVDRAVRSYIRPQDGDGMSSVLEAGDAGEAARRQAMLGVVAGRDRDVIDRLRAAQDDQRLARSAAAGAKKQADARRDAVQGELGRVSRARADQVRVKDALDRRIGAFQAEADALAREEAGLAALIRQRQAARASRGGGSGIDGRVSGAGLIWPVQGRVTSEYGPRWGRTHEGIDISAPSGTPIRAAKAGEVIFVGQQGGYGNMTLVDHGGGFVTAYPHQSRFGTSEGAVVAQGQVIGYVGCSGSCTGPHLHFETRVNGSAENPRRYLP